MQINANQLAVAKSLSEPYGNAISATGPLADVNRYWFSSKEFDLHSGLYYFKHRFYAPSFQRWLNRDPIQEFGGINTYSFVRSDPIDRADPLGLQSFLFEPPPVGAFLEFSAKPPVVPRTLVEEAIKANEGASRVKLPDGPELDLFGRGHF